MSEDIAYLPAGYRPPSVWSYKENGGRFAAINRDTSGARYEQPLPVGRHPLQLYSLGSSPNGQKITIMLEELLALGHAGAQYDAWLVRIGSGQQFGSGFVEINPNSKIPAMVDQSGPKPVPIFESGAILVHLAEKFGEFLPTEPVLRAQCLSWLFWQMAATPALGFGFGHFYAYGPVKIEYAIDRCTMEVKRQLDVLDKRLANNPYIAGEAYTIADMAIWPWYAALIRNEIYDAARFLSAHDYAHVHRWADAIALRPAVERGRRVNRPAIDPADRYLPERHDAADFDRADAMARNGKLLW